MRIKRKSPCFILAAMVLLLLPTAALAADVDVFAEGAYNAQYLDVYIYANINTGNLCSYGVKLTYDKTRLNTPTATKNVAVWYFGSSSPGNTYMDPVVDSAASPATITFIGGKLDTGNPTAGVTGMRVLLGSVRFVRTEGSLDLGPTAETYFGITASLGRPSPYDNFVTTGGQVRDSGVVYSVTVRQRGDANGDGYVNVQDMSMVRSYIVSGGTPYAWMDCNSDTAVNVQDMSCVRSLIITGHY